MTAKDYLMRIYNLDKEIASKQSERDEIMSTLVKAVDTTATPDFNAGTVSNPTENTVIRLMQYNDQTNQYIDELVELKIQVAEDIMELDSDNHKMVLRERYIKCKKWEEIAVEQNYDLRYIYKLHGFALNEFGEKHKDKLKQDML